MCLIRTGSNIRQGDARYSSQSLYVREENLARQIKDAIQKVAIDDGLFSQLMKEVNRQKALLEADKIYNERLAGSKIQEIDLQLERLLNLSVSGVISAEEYREKKAQLINRKFELQAGGNSDGKWLEHLKNFVTLAHQASCIALGLLEEQTIKIFGIHRNPKNFYGQITKRCGIISKFSARTLGLR